MFRFQPQMSRFIALELGVVVVVEGQSTTCTETGSEGECPKKKKNSIEIAQPNRIPEYYPFQFLLCMGCIHWLAWLGSPLHGTLRGPCFGPISDHSSGEWKLYQLNSITEEFIQETVKRGNFLK